MSIITRPVIAILLLGLAVSCGSPQVEPEAPASDTLYTPAHIQELAETDYDAAMALTDEGMQRGQLSAFTAYQLKSKFTYLQTNNFSDAARWLRKALEQEEAREPATRMDLLYHLATILKGAKDYTACLATCTEGKELAHGLGDTYQMHAFDFMAGTTLFDMGEDETGLRMMHGALKGASGVADSMEEYGHLLYFASTLINNYLSVNDYAAALEECAAFEQMIESMHARYPDTPESYLDRSRFYLDVDRAVCYVASGNRSLAARSFLRARSCAFAQTEGGRIRQVEYYAAAGVPDSILVIYEEIPFPDADTVSRVYRRRLSRLSEAYRNAGMEREAASYDARYRALSEQIHAREQAEGILTRVAEYDSQQYRLALSDTTSLLEKYRRHFIVTLVGLALVLVGFFFLNQALSKRKVRRFNQQADALKKDMKSLQKMVSLITEKELSGDDADGKPSLERLIEGKELYLKKDLNRDSAAALLGITHAEVTRMLNDIEPGLSFPDYIKGLRIRHALKLMAANPNIPISDLAERSGFYTVRTLQRTFLAVTGKTPSEYAKELKQK